MVANLTDDELRERVVKAIKDSGKSQAEIAREIGVSQSTITQWKDGKKLSNQLPVLRLILGACAADKAA